MYIYIYMDPHIWPSKSRDDQLEHTYSSYVKIREDTEDLPEAMNDREKWRERVRDIRASGSTWWLYIYIYIYVKLAILVEGDPKAPFSIAITARCKGGSTSFPSLLHFTLNPYLIMLSVKQGAIKYHFLIL